MMRRISILAILLASTYIVSAYAQRTCKDCIHNLYKMLGSYRMERVSINTNTYAVKTLYQGKSGDYVVAAIPKARVFSYGNPFDSVVMLDLGDKALFFMVNTEPPLSTTYAEINEIYDSEGRNLQHKESYMQFPAVINDPDGITYVREGPSTKHKVKAKIPKNKIFFYTPLFGKDWYRVYLKDGGPCIGYVHRTRILPYDKCPTKVKRKMEKLMF